MGILDKYVRFFRLENGTRAHFPPCAIKNNRLRFPIKRWPGPGINLEKGVSYGKVCVFAKAMRDA